SACARDSGLSTTMPPPSPRPKPLACAENALQRPSGASARRRESATEIAGEVSTVAPPASATLHSPWRSAWHARWSATSDVEQPALLGIHAECLARRDAEERRVELVVAVDQRVLAHVHLAPRVGIGVVVEVDVHALGRDRPHGIDAAIEQVPVLLRIARAAR